MLWWHPIVLVCAAAAAWFSYRLNTSEHIGWMVALWMLNAIPLWALIAKRSDALLLDGVVYDILLTIGYTVTVIWLTKGSLTFSVVQWACIIIILAALVVLKMN